MTKEYIEIAFTVRGRVMTLTEDYDGGYDLRLDDKTVLSTYESGSQEFLWMRKVLEENLAQLLDDICQDLTNAEFQEQMNAQRARVRALAKNGEAGSPDPGTDQGEEFP